MDERTKPEFKLKVELVGDTEFILRRQFRAPRELVFKCFTDPALLSKWLGCDMGVVLKCEVDTSIGGVWRHVMNMGSQGQFETFGQTLAFEPPQRLVRSCAYNIPEAVESITAETATFTESSGVTTVEILVRHLSKVSRDAHLESGVEYGAGTSFDSLEKFIRADLH